MATTSRSRPSAPGALEGGVEGVREREPFELAEALASLSTRDLEDLSAEQAEVVVVATQRLTNALAALQTAAVSTYAHRVEEDLEEYRAERRREFEERREQAAAEGRTFTERWHPIPGEAGFAAAALAPLLHVSPRTMAARIERARRVDHDMPGTWTLARSGDLEPYRVDAVVRATAPLEDDDLEEFEARLFADDVDELSTGRLADRARRAAGATNREAVEEAAERARRKRSVSARPDRDLPGMTSWRLLLPSETSRQMWAAVDALAREYHLARREAGDPITLDQARADAIADLVLARARVETTVELIVPVAAMTGQGPGHGGAGCGHGGAAGGRRGGTGLGRHDAPAADHPGRAVFYGDPRPSDLHQPPARPPIAGTYRWAERRTPAQVLRGRGVLDDLVLRWVGGEELHRASVLEAELALLLGGHHRVTGNPNLRHPPPPEGPPPRGGPAPPGRPAAPAPPGRWAPAGGDAGSSCPAADEDAGVPGPGAWFVPGHVDDSRVGTLLPEGLTALLADPDTRIRIAGSDPATGAAVTDSTDAYRPGRPMAGRVRRRDGTCRFPGCATPADRCQLDHVVRWPDGPTEEGNRLTLCATHHGFKHHAGWRLTMTADGIVTWTAPTGRSHTTRPRAAHSVSV